MRGDRRAQELVGKQLLAHAAEEAELAHEEEEEEEEEQEPPPFAEGGGADEGGAPSLTKGPVPTGAARMVKELRREDPPP